MRKWCLGFVLVAMVGFSHAGFYVDDEPAPAVGSSRDVGAPVSSAPRGQLAGAIRPQAEQVEWVSEPGQTLKHALIAWAERAGWKLSWEVVDGEDDIDYPIPGVLRAQGSIDRAVGSIVRLYLKAEVPLKADISVNDRFIRIVSAGKSK